ncbi:hypothetical protein WMY93_024285 [Mugilogobius chulae]|uniref:Uncharacterized protein n=1 Tax=Mugilogobius chulae TaxID=88201 RepID=A0AAW0N9I0_9GOBI
MKAHRPGARDGKAASFKHGKERTRSARRGPDKAHGDRTERAGGPDPERGDQTRSGEGMSLLEHGRTGSGAHGENRPRSVQEYRLKHGQTGPGARGKSANRLEMDTTTGRTAVLETYKSWRRTSPGDVQVLETCRSCRLTGPGDAQVLKTYRSWNVQVLETHRFLETHRSWRRTGLETCRSERLTGPGDAQTLETSQVRRRTGPGDAQVLGRTGLGQTVWRRYRSWRRTGPGELRSWRRTGPGDAQVLESTGPGDTGRGNVQVLETLSPGDVKVLERWKAAVNHLLQQSTQCAAQRVSVPDLAPARHSDEEVRMDSMMTVVTCTLSGPAA